MWAWVTEYMQVSMLVNTMLYFNKRYLHIFNHPRLYPSIYDTCISYMLQLTPPPRMPCSEALYHLRTSHSKYHPESLVLSTSQPNLLAKDPYKGR